MMVKADFVPLDVIWEVRVMDWLVLEEVEDRANSGVAVIIEI